mmetsp:Transcript_10747/g.21001  ORF Transcript_10747/g.21001 Transcript_10747/m.21001 type:complete len:87 (-) Transcript_10747:2147-2407(-)
MCEVTLFVKQKVMEDLSSTEGNALERLLISLLCFELLLCPIFIHSPPYALYTQVPPALPFKSLHHFQLPYRNTGSSITSSIAFHQE